MLLESAAFSRRTPNPVYQHAGLPARKPPLAVASIAIAEAVVLLVDGARAVTGELILLDSGMHLGGAPGNVVAAKT